MFNVEIVARSTVLELDGVMVACTVDRPFKIPLRLANSCLYGDQRLTDLAMFLRE